MNLFIVGTPAAEITAPAILHHSLHLQPKYLQPYTFPVYLEKDSSAFDVGTIAVSFISIVGGVETVMTATAPLAYIDKVSPNFLYVTIIPKNITFDAEKIQMRFTNSNPTTPLVTNIDLKIISQPIINEIFIGKDCGSTALTDVEVDAYQ